MYLIHILIKNEMTNDLTDDELDNILLSNEYSVRQVKDPVKAEKPLDLKHLSKKKRKYTKKKGAKKPGRPTIWTKEKIANNKARRKAVARAKAHVKRENEKQNKLLLAQPFTDTEKRMAISDVIDDKKALKDNLLNERNEEIRLRENIDFTPVCDHVDKFVYINTEGYFVSSCIFCSRSRSWIPYDWDVYFTKTKKLMGD
jgi:hypothetical protein